MKYRKIIFINYQPINSSIVDNFYINDLLFNSVEVEYWDLSNIYFPNLKFYKNLNLEYITKFYSLNDICDKLKNIDTNKILFVSLITYDGTTINLFRILTKFKCNLAIFARGMLPPIQSTYNSLTLRLLKLLNKKKVIKYYKNKIAFFLKKIGYIKTYNYIFQAGELGHFTIGVGSQLDIKNSYILNINYFDYDKYLELKQKNIQDGKHYNYCVFLDEFLPFHPDFKLLNVNTVEPEQYYKNLNSFFNSIENIFKIKVIICGHPKSKNNIDLKLFNNRKVVFDKTAELVKNSQFVLAHGSSSISYAILYKKSVISLYSNDIMYKMKDYFNFIQSFSIEIDSQLFNLDTFQDQDLKHILLPNYTLYELYKNNYLTTIVGSSVITKTIFLKFINT